ncbi:MAG: lytic transglycosylase domain-containing protein [Flavobacteriales bacterium]
MTNRYYLVSALIGLLSSALVLVLFSFADKNKPTKAENDAYRNVINGEYRIFAMPLPEQMDFAGEQVPLDRPDVRESLDRELLVNTYWHSNTLLTIKRAYRWFPVIEPILKSNGIPDDFKYLAVIESSLSNATSPAGAKGFWQFLDETGRSYGLEVSAQVDERYDVEKSTYAACHFLKDAFDRYGSWSMAAASYNMGMAGLQRATNQQYESTYWDLLLNEETARYVYRILAMKEIFTHADQYGFVLRPAELYEPLRVNSVRVENTIPDLAAFAKEKGLTYKLLKWYNPWLRENSLKVTAGKSYAIKIPS